MTKTQRPETVKQVNHSPSKEWSKSFMLGEKLLASVDWATKGRRRIEEVRRKSRNAHQNTENFSPY